MTRTLHLVRAGAGAAPATIAEVMAAGDWLVYLDPLRLAERGAPPLPPGPIDHEQLVALAFAADRVVTW